MKFIVLCVLSLLLAGCDLSSSDNGRYQISASGGGFVHRIDTKTGTVWNCTSNKCIKISIDPMN